MAVGARIIERLAHRVGALLHPGLFRRTAEFVHANAYDADFRHDDCSRLRSIL